MGSDSRSPEDVLSHSIIGGAMNIRELQRVELCIAPAIKTEGKLFQKAQRIGMGK